jgi:alkanesulfonate monooxygenase SsuD/methylene tetrahydromethanopterin reductase-like flavin-dependent oxidoreductase (luciferase family)
VDAYLAGDPVSFSGKHISMPETYFSVRTRQARPDIYVAGMAGDPETQRRAVERGYVPFFTTGWNTIEVVEQIRAKVVETHAAAGADADRVPFALQRYVFVTDAKEDALAAADGARYIRRIAMAMRNNYGELDGAFLKETPAADEPPLEEIVERLPMGDPEKVAERLAVDIERLAPTHVSCFMGIPGMPQHKIMRSIELFGTKVMPLLEKRFGSLERLGVPVPRARAA